MVWLTATWAILLESAGWVMISLLLGGLIHEFLPTSGLHRRLRSNSAGALGGAVALGAVLPICSCGVVPLAVSMYRSGVSLSTVMAFTVATPIINPAAVILSLALLGPELTFAYVLLGLLLPVALGLACRLRWVSQGAVVVPPVPAETHGCCESGAPTAPRRGVGRRVIAGLRWGLLTLGPTISMYLALGLALAGLVIAVVPSAWTSELLGPDSAFGLLGAGLLGAIIYVCAVAHIPLVASLLAVGAAPGAAIVFLVTGTATNLPELLALYKTLGRRVVVLYALGLIASSIAAGLWVNAWLSASYVPSFDPLGSLALLDRADSVGVGLPAWLNQLGAVVLIVLAGLGGYRRWQARTRTAAGGCCGDAAEPVDQVRGH